MKHLPLGLLLALAAPVRSAGADIPTVLAPPPSLTLPAAPLNSVQHETAIELPPMIISETSKAPPWLYARTGDNEYLSRCSASTTRAFIIGQLQVRQLLEVFVPTDFLPITSVLNVSILTPRQTGPGADDAVSREMLRMEQQTKERTIAEESDQNRARPVSNYRFLPNLRLDDRDMRAVFTFVDEKNFRSESLVAAPEYVYARLMARIPTLPAWLIEGISSLYQQSNFREEPITVRPASWISRDDTAGLKLDPESRRVLMPPGDFFAADAFLTPEDRNPARVAAWRAQAVLFIRWALDPANAPAADALWKLARRISQEPASEAIFIECFGFGYADLQDRLSDYLPTAVAQPVRIPTGKLPALPRFEVKPATPEQIARLRGEWERLEIPFVREKHPEFVERYVDQALATLRRPVGAGSREPQLLATLGLCELDAGDAVAARPWLEQAAAAKVVRPRLHFEVARLRWLDLTRETGEKSGFTVAQLQPVLAPLRVAAAQTPPLPEVYMLMADAWLRCGERARASDLPLLLEAVPLFRRIPAMGYRVALLLVREAQRAAAVQLLTTGISFVTDPVPRAQYQALLDVLVAAQTPAETTKP